MAFVIKPRYSVWNIARLAHLAFPAGLTTERPPVVQSRVWRRSASAAHNGIWPIDPCRSEACRLACMLSCSEVRCQQDNQSQESKTIYEQKDEMVVPAKWVGKLKWGSLSTALAATISTGHKSWNAFICISLITSAACFTKRGYEWDFRPKPISLPSTCWI